MVKRSVIQRHSFQEFASKIKANGDSKLNAAADFAARLLNSFIGISIALIILFGNVARNQVGSQSDVDVMVFSEAPRWMKQKSIEWRQKGYTARLGDILRVLS